MGQQYDVDGVIYEQGADGRYHPVPPRSQPRPTVQPLPISPQQASENARNDAAAGRDEVRTGIAARGEGRDISRTAFDQTAKLRGEFEGSKPVDNYRTIIRQYMAGLQAEPTAAGDQALINSYATMLNPTSTVQLGEYQATEQIDTAIQRIKTRLAKEFGWDGAGRISDDARRQLRAEMLNLTKNANRAYNQQYERYATLAQRNGFDPQDVVGAHLGEPYLNDIQTELTQQYTADRRGASPSVDADPEGLSYGNPGMGEVGTVSDRRAPPPPQGPQNGFGQSYLGQGMSGVNEGMANTLGLPIDIVTGAMNLVPKGLNAAANTNIPEIRNPFGGSDYIKNLMDGWAIRPESNDPSKQFVRRIGQSIGASSVPLAGTSSSLGQFGRGMFGAAGGGVGGATAQQLFPGNPAAEFAGELLGSGATSLGQAAVRRAGVQREIEANIPTVEQLKQQAGDLYRQAESRGVTADPTMTQDLADKLRQALTDKGRISPTGRISAVYPKVEEAVKLADDYAGKTMNPTQMQTVRGIMADGLMSKDGSERNIARNLTDTFDDWANPQAPELAQARNVASRYLNAQQLEQARELAAARAGQFSGSGFENALRTEYRALDRNAVKGNGRYGADLEQSIQDVSRGTPMSNFARNVGKYAPTGVVSSSLGAGGGFYLGNAIGGPGVGTALGAAVAGTGHLGRNAATRLGIRNADVAEMVARNGGAIPQAPLLDAETIRALAAVLSGATANLSGDLSARR